MKKDMKKKGIIIFLLVLIIISLSLIMTRITINQKEKLDELKRLSEWEKYKEYQRETEIKYSNYSINTEKTNSYTNRTSNLSCESTTECDDFCYYLGNFGVISYSPYCENNFCVCSAYPYSD